MTFLEAIQAPIRKAFVFSGRSSRMEYWSFSLAWIVVIVGFGVVVGTTGPIVGTLYLVLYVASFVPLLTVSVRRLHDHDRTGWWLLAGFIPFVGSLVLCYFMIQPSDRGSNAYGANPNGDAVADALARWVAFEARESTIPGRPPGTGADADPS